MSIRAGQYQLASFTRPAQNERPITSAVVRGQDNTIATTFNLHDSDQSLHVQSGVLADRPLPGTLGRVFVTYDVPTAPLIWLDNGVGWVSQSADWSTISNRPTSFPPAPFSAVLVTTGTLDDARLSGNIPRLNQMNSFTSNQIMGSGGASIIVGAGATDYGYIEFRPRTAAPTTAWAYLGFGAAADTALTLAHQQNGDIRLLTASANVTLKPSGRFEIPSGLTKLGAVNYTWPLADGASGHVLKTDGAGTLSFSAVTGTGTGTTVAWVDITGRPALFSPAAHTHPTTDIQAGTLPTGVLLGASQLAAGAIPGGVTLPYGQLTGVPSTFAPATHNQAFSTITGVPTYLPADWNTTLFNKPILFPPQSHRQDYSTLDNVPTTFPPQAHTHLWVQITDKPTTFTPSAHSHVITDVTGLQPALDTKTTQGGTGTFANGTLGGNPLAAIIVSTAAPSGVAVAGTLWARV